MAKLMREDSDLNHSRSITCLRRHDDIIINPDILAIFSWCLGLVSASSQTREGETMRPDILVAAALTTDSWMDKSHEINEAIVVPGIRDAIRTIVVVLRKIDLVDVLVQQLLQIFSKLR